MPKRLALKGLVVASLHVNHRRSGYGAMQPPQAGMLSLYVICGIDWLLVEWEGDKLRFTELHSA